MNDSSEHKKTGYGLCALLFFLALIIGVGILLLAIGIIRVPWISQWFPKPQEVARRIELSQSDIDSERRSLENKVGNIAFLMRTATPENPVDASLAITERELTALLLSGAENMPLSDMQAVINPDGVEVSGKVSQPFEGILLVQALPVVRSGKIEFDIKKVAIGGLTVPSSFADSIVKAALSSRLDQAHAEIKKVGEIGDIKLEKGQATVSAHIVNGSALLEQKQE